jgi:peptide/nickel transport system permease protein
LPNGNLPLFTILGFGKLIAHAVLNRDYAVAQGIVLCTTITYLLADIA